MRKSFFLTAILALALAGCGQMQRTDLLTVDQFNQLTQANNQLAGIPVGQLQKALECTKQKDPSKRATCAQAYINQLVSQLEAPRKAYGHTAHRMRGKCGEDLDKISQGLDRLQASLKSLGKALAQSNPSQLTAAAAELQKAWSGVPAVNSFVKDCSAQSKKK